MKNLRKQLEEIVKKEVKQALNEMEEIHTIHTRPLLLAISDQLIDKERVGLEIPREEEVAEVEDDPWAANALDHGLYFYTVGYLPEDIVLPRKRRDLVASSGWYLGMRSGTGKYFKGPFQSKDAAVEAAGPVSND